MSGIIAAVEPALEELEKALGTLGESGTRAIRQKAKLGIRKLEELREAIVDHSGEVGLFTEHYDSRLRRLEERLRTDIKDNLPEGFQQRAVALADKIGANRDRLVEGIVSSSSAAVGLRGTLEPLAIILDEINVFSSVLPNNTQKILNFVSTLFDAGYLGIYPRAASRESRSLYNDVAVELDRLVEALTNDGMEGYVLGWSRTLTKVFKFTTRERVSAILKELSSQTESLKTVNEETKAEIERIESFEAGAARCIEVVKFAGSVLQFVALI